MVVGLLCPMPEAAVAQQPAPTAPLVTPRDLRPQAAPPTAPQVPEAAPTQAPPRAAELFVTPADIVVDHGFPEFASATEALIAPIRGKRVAVSEFYGLANRIERLYQDAGYRLVRVTVPPQRVDNGGTVRLHVVDGFIEGIDTRGLDERARPAVEAALRPLVGQRHVTEAAIERALMVAGQEPGVTLRSAIGAGKEEGGSVLVIEGQQQLATATFEADNRLSQSLGTWETTLQVAINQPFQMGEQFYGYVSGGADEHPFSSFSPRRVAGGGVQIPLGHDGLMLNPEFTWSDTQPISNGTTLREVSKFERETLRLIDPVILDHSQSLTLTGTVDVTRQTDLARDFGALLDADQLRVGRIQVQWNGTVPWWDAHLSTGVILSKGFAILGARTDNQANSSGIGLSRFDEDPNFVKAELNLTYSQDLPFGIQATFAGHGQQALRGVLPTSELFSLDGEDRLSTFTTGALSNDSGWTLRQEFARPFPISEGQVTVNAVPYIFGAYGDGVSAIRDVPGVGYNSSYGAGLRLNWNIVSTSMELGRRISGIPGLSATQFFFKGQVQF